MEKTPHIVWGLVVAVLIVAIFSTIQRNLNTNLEFDKACISAGKTVVWETKPGADSPVKECK